MLEPQRHYQVVELDRLPEASELDERLSPYALERTQWLFRGQGDASWRLMHALERAVFRACVEAGDLATLPQHEAATAPAMAELHRTVLRRGLRLQVPVLGPDRLNVAMIEAALIRQFKRKTYHFLSDTPSDKDFPEWLALMQHHGAPTRMLDATFSFHVAAFFALESADGPSAVWAIDSAWINESCREIRWRKHGSKAGFEYDLNCQTPEHFSHLFQIAELDSRFGPDTREDRIPYVFSRNPYRLNERLTIQQGGFLIAGDVNLPFEENLAAMLEASDGKRVVKLVLQLEPEQRREALRRLYRMNMSRATLFPGLDGFARSLESQLLLPHTLAIDPAEFKGPSSRD